MGGLSPLLKLTIDHLGYLVLAQAVHQFSFQGASIAMLLTGGLLPVKA